MQNIKGNSEIISNCDYELIGYFTLPPCAWWDDYYNPLEQKLFDLRIKYKNDQKVLEILKSEQDEIRLYRKYSDYNGNVFYLMKSRGLPSDN